MIEAMAFHVLVIDDEEELALSLAEYLQSFSMSVDTLCSPERWRAKLSGQEYGAILLDIRMPQVTGIDLIQQIRAEHWQTPIIMISGYASVDNIVRCMKYGALNFFEKPLDLTKLREELLRLKSVRPRGDEGSLFDSIVTENTRMREILRVVEKTARTDATVLITGESGTGKEMIANSLHYSSERRDRPFVKLNCAAIPDNLMESEMFGYEAGAFTDARQRKLGKFEVADGGSLFFDEIAELSRSMQAKLLRVLNDQQFERLGGHEPIQANVRIIAATNRDLAKEVAERRFREDLYYRLAVITVEVPPLRERREDIIPLAHHFLNHYSRTYHRDVSHLDDQVRGRFLAHDWPGNVRELKNAIERAVIFCEDGTLGASCLPAQYRDVNPIEVSDLSTTYDSLSRELILDALRRTNGHKQRAAELLNVHRKTLYNRMKKLGIQT
jgi:two-component system response regulator AtoC